MTAIDTHTETHVDEVAVHAPPQGDGLYRLVASNDHKMVGRLWIGASIAFLILLAVLGVVNNLERADTDAFSIFSGVSGYFQGWVLFRTGIIFMVVVPMFIGIATAITPLQVGSASIAFPRLAAASFWAWLFGSIVHAVSFAVDGGFGFAANTRSDSTLLSITSFGAMLIALLTASVCIATTVVALRSTGMTLLRVPTFSWSMLVATSVWLFSFPVLLAGLIFSYVDLKYGEVVDFGNADLMWDRISWAWAQPQIYAYAIPVLGIFGEIIPVLAKQRQPLREATLSFIGLFGLLSFGAWAQSFYPTIEATNADAGQFRNVVIYKGFLYGAFAVAAVLPVLAVFGGGLDTIRRGSAPKPSAALLGAVLGALLLLTAAIVGFIRVMPFADVLHENNILLSSTTAQMGLVVGASLTAAVGAISYWSPKLFGGYGGNGAGIGGVMAFAGAGAILGLANLVAAFDGQPDIAVDTVGDLANTMNMLSIMGSAMLILGGLSILGVIVPAATSDETLPDDPWEGHTLEWAAPSPPPVGNFVEPLEPVLSAEPLLDELEEVN